MTYDTVFDASRQSNVMDWLMPIGLVVAAFFVFASSRMRSRLPYGMGYIVPFLALIAAIIAAIAPFARRSIVSRDLSTGHDEVLEGPVTEYMPPTTGAKGFVPGHFTVRGRRFSIPNYIVTMGFDDQGHAIEVGRVVRITHDAEMILRVEVRR